MAAKRPSSGAQSSQKRQRGNTPEGFQVCLPHVSVNNAERNCWGVTLHYWDMNGYEALGDIKFQMLGEGTELCWSDNFALTMSKLAACVAFRNDVEFFRLFLKVVYAVRHQSKRPNVRGTRVSSNVQALRDEIYAHYLNGFSGGDPMTIIEQAIIKHTTMVPRKHLAMLKDKYIYTITPQIESETLSGSSIVVDQEDLNNLMKVFGAYALDTGLETIDSSWKTHGHTEISDGNFRSIKLRELRRLGLVTQLHYFPNQISIKQYAKTTFEDAEPSATNQGLVCQKSTNFQNIKRTAVAIVQDHENYNADADPEEVRSLSLASLRNTEDTEREVGEGIPNQIPNEAENLKPSHMFIITDSPDISRESNTDTEDEAESLESNHTLTNTSSRDVSEVSNIDTDLLIWGSSYGSEEPGSENDDLLTRESSRQSEEPEMSHVIQFRLEENIDRIIDETVISSVASFKQLVGWIQPFLASNFTLWVKESSNGEASLIESDDDWAIAKEQFREEYDNRFVTTIFVTDYEFENQSTSVDPNSPETSFDVDSSTGYEEEDGSEWEP